MTELDNMTQQNSALVEETASASEEMSNQAEELLSTVQKFKVDANLVNQLLTTSQKTEHIESLHKQLKGKKVNVNGAQMHYSTGAGASQKILSDVVKSEGFEEF